MSSGSASSRRVRSARMRALRLRRRGVDLVPRQVGVDLLDHDAVVLARALDRDVAVDDVLADVGGVALQRVAVAAAAGRRPGEHVALLDRHVGEDRAEEALVVGAAVQPHAVRDRRQAALDAPGDRARAVAAVGDDGPLRLRQRRALLHAAAAAEAARAAGVGEDLVAGREDRAEPLLALQGLHRQPDAEHRRRAVGAVAAVAPAPAADHPVVPHEERPALAARVAPADEQVLEVERAGDRPLGHDLRPDLEGAVHDLLVRAGAEAGHRDRPRRVDDRALRPEVDVHRPVEAGVERHLGEEGLRPADDAREGRAEAGVEERADRRVRPGQVVADLVALDRHLDLDRDQPLLERRVGVDVVLRLPHAVGQLGDAGRVRFST